MNLDKIQEFIDMGRLKPKDNFFVTMRDLYTAGLLSSFDGGVKVLSRVCWESHYHAEFDTILLYISRSHYMYLTKIHHLA